MCGLPDIRGRNVTGVVRTKTCELDVENTGMLTRMTRDSWLASLCGGRKFCIVSTMLPPEFKETDSVPSAMAALAFFCRYIYPQLVWLLLEGKVRRIASARG